MQERIELIVLFLIFFLTIIQSKDELISVSLRKYTPRSSISSSTRIFHSRTSARLRWLIVKDASLREIASRSYGSITPGLFCYRNNGAGRLKTARSTRRSSELAHADSQQRYSHRRNPFVHPYHASSVFFKYLSSFLIQLSPLQYFYLFIVNMYFVLLLLSLVWYLLVYFTVQPVSPKYDGRFFENISSVFER